VRNQSDNAYLWIATVGFGLYVVGIPFILTAALPNGLVRKGLLYLSLGLLWLIGGLGCYSSSSERS
jgi:hypothetical protein